MQGIIGWCAEEDLPKDKVSPYIYIYIYIHFYIYLKFDIKIWKQPHRSMWVNYSGFKRVWAEWKTMGFTYQRFCPKIGGVYICWACEFCTWYKSGKQQLPRQYIHDIISIKRRRLKMNTGFEEVQRNEVRWKMQTLRR
jgi:hypothetical protein